MLFLEWYQNDQKLVPLAPAAIKGYLSIQAPQLGHIIVGDLKKIKQKMNMGRTKIIW